MWLDGGLDWMSRWPATVFLSDFSWPAGGREIEGEGGDGQIRTGYRYVTVGARGWATRSECTILRCVWLRRRVRAAGGALLPRQRWTADRKGAMARVRGVLWGGRGPLQEDPKGTSNIVYRELLIVPEINHEMCIILTPSVD
eukprot:COSAG02_NODE_24542_length_685_cov_0.694539_1_plen_142_part_00